MQDKTRELFQNAPVPKAVLTNIIPSIVSMIMVLLYNLADTYFIGQTKNALMVAAVSVATPAFLLFMGILGHRLLTIWTFPFLSMTNLSLRSLHAATQPK